MLTVARSGTIRSAGDGPGVGYGPADLVLPPTEPIVVLAEPDGR
ncbi:MULTISPECIES: hypothetical protein [unclassified Microbacterium]